MKLPLALPVILAGPQLSAVTNMGMATIGSMIAAQGLGEVIIAGLQTPSTAFTVQGGLIVELLAVLTYEGTEEMHALSIGQAKRIVD